MTIIVNDRRSIIVGASVPNVLQDRTVLDQSAAGVDTVLSRQLIPAGMFAIGRKIRIKWAGSKNGAAVAANFYCRLGLLGTTADAQIHPSSIQMTSSHYNFASYQEFLRLDANTVRILTTALATPFTTGGSTSIVTADASYAGSPGLLDGAFYVTLSCSLVTEVFTNRHFMVEML